MPPSGPPEFCLDVCDQAGTAECIEEPVEECVCNTGYTGSDCSISKFNITLSKVEDRKSRITPQSRFFYGNLFHFMKLEKHLLEIFCSHSDKKILIQNIIALSSHINAKAVLLMV